MRSPGGPVTHSLVKALRAVPDFALLDDRTLLKIFSASANLFWPGGARVFDKGSPGDALYIVLSGRIRIFDVLDGGELDVAWVEPGGYFGDLSLLRNTTHSKGAEAAADSELMVVAKDALDELLAADPDLAAYVRSRFEDRASSYDGSAPADQAD